MVTSKDFKKSHIDLKDYTGPVPIKFLSVLSEDISKKPNAPPNTSFINYISIFSKIINFVSESVFQNGLDPLFNVETQMYQNVQIPLYRYFVQVDQNCKIWTTSTVPYTIMKKWRQNILEKSYIEFYHLDMPVMVLIHGFNSGSGYWTLNYDQFAKHKVPIFAIDLPGFAHSSRIQFHIEQDISESIFINSIEKWRQILNLNKIILIGHSFGGYLSSCYCLKYPNSVTNLLLADPWGFPDFKEELTKVMLYESPSEMSDKITKFNGWFRVIIFILKPFTPFSILRMLGLRLSNSFISKTRPDIARIYEKHLGPNATNIVNSYIYLTNCQKPTGEYSMRAFSNPVGWAYKPMLKRLEEIDPNIELTFIYGSRSWITYESGIKAEKLLPNNIVNTFLIKNAGHQLFSDNPDDFCKAVATGIKNYLKLNNYDQSEFLEPIKLYNEEYFDDWGIEHEFLTDTIE